MSEEMKFSDTLDEFIKQYSFIDEEQIYTNGSELIPTFRVKQWEEHKIKENQELKKQLEENQNPLKGIFAQVNDDTLLRDCGNMNAEINELKNQQKEFIEYLENEKDRLIKETSHYYIDSFDRQHAVNETIYDEVDIILQKYREIIGDDK